MCIDYPCCYKQNHLTGFTSFAQHTVKFFNERAETVFEDLSCATLLWFTMLPLWSLPITGNLGNELGHVNDQNSWIKWIGRMNFPISTSTDAVIMRHWPRFGWLQFRLNSLISHFPLARCPWRPASSQQETQGQESRLAKSGLLCTSMWQITALFTQIEQLRSVLP